MADAVLNIACSLLLMAVGIGGMYCSIMMFRAARLVEDAEAQMCLAFLAFCGIALSVLSLLFGIWIFSLVFLQVV